MAEGRMEEIRVGERKREEEEGKGRRRKKNGGGWQRVERRGERGRK